MALVAGCGDGGGTDPEEGTDGPANLGVPVPVFLRDNSVPTLDNLLDPVRGATAPHPFYLSDPSQRAQMVAFLQGLDTGNSTHHPLFRGETKRDTRLAAFDTAQRPG